MGRLSKGASANRKPLRILLLIAALFAGISGFAQNASINWLSWNEMVEKMKTDPRPVFIDTYTDWCGWCKRMDQTTFKDSAIVEYMNKHYYAVKLDAEMKDTIVFRDQVFFNVNPNSKKGVHTLAASLLDSKLSYPSFVFLNADFSRSKILPGYQRPPQLEKWIRYYVEGAAKGQTLEAFESSYESFYKSEG